MTTSTFLFGPIHSLTEGQLCRKVCRVNFLFLFLSSQSITILLIFVSSNGYHIWLWGCFYGYMLFFWCLYNRCLSSFSSNFLRLLQRFSEICFASEKYYQNYIFFVTFLSTSIKTEWKTLSSILAFLFLFPYFSALHLNWFFGKENWESQEWNSAEIWLCFGFVLV